MDLGMPNKDGFEASSDILQRQVNLSNLEKKSEVEKRLNNKECEIVVLTSF